MQIGDEVPNIQFEATNGLKTTFKHYRGKWLVLYFYPKDATPGCTTEGCEFRDLEKEFSFLNTVILGISRDSLTSHEKFKSTQQFPFELISDKDETLCKLFDVIKTKMMYGKTVLGIERSTFLIDPNGTIKYIWRKVSVKDHVTTVLNTVKSLQRT